MAGEHNRDRAFECARIKIIMRYVLLALAVIGIAASSLALREHYRTYGEAPCDINDRWDCGIVNHSPYAVIHGVPVAVIGIAGFSALWLHFAYMFGALKVSDGVDSFLRDLFLAVLVINAFFLYRWRGPLGGVGRRHDEDTTHARRFRSVRRRTGGEHHDERSSDRSQRSLFLPHCARG